MKPIFLVRRQRFFVHDNVQYAMAPDYNDFRLYSNPNNAEEYVKGKVNLLMDQGAEFEDYINEETNTMVYAQVGYIDGVRVVYEISERQVH